MCRIYCYGCFANYNVDFCICNSYPTNDLEQWRFIFIDKDPKWTKLKTIQGQPKNGTYLKSGDSLFYGENGGKKVDISFGVGLSAQYEGVSASVTFSIPMGKAYDTYYGKALKAHKDGYYVIKAKKYIKPHIQLIQYRYRKNGETWGKWSTPTVYNKSYEVLQSYSVLVKKGN